MSIWTWLYETFIGSEDCHMAAFRKQQDLPKGFESKLLFLTRTNGSSHIYLVYKKPEGELYAWDSKGTHPLFIKEWDVTPATLVRWIEGEGPKNAYFG